jgi:HdeA/HdeB family
MVRRALIVAAFAALTAATGSLPASATVVDTAAISCKEIADSFNSSSAEDQYGASTILYWLAGYHATEGQGTVVDFDNVVKGMEKTVEFCGKNPAVGAFSASANFMGGNLPKAAPGAIDLAIMKCAALAESTDKDADGLGQIMMWLAGYHSGDEGSKLLDLDAFTANTEKLGAYCSEHPDIGLVTATEEVMSVE